MSNIPKNIPESYRPSQMQVHHWKTSNDAWQTREYVRQIADYLLTQDAVIASLNGRIAELEAARAAQAEVSVPKTTKTAK